MDSSQQDAETDTQTAMTMTEDSTPINEITIRMWELDGNSTHYDRMIAAPADSDLVKFWYGWSVIMLTTGVVTTLILIPLLFSRSKIRDNPFNVYLIFLMTPDMMVAWICGFTCLSNAIAGHFTTPFMCKFQSFYMIASIGANSWLNLLITRQLYLMLSKARRFQRYHMPKTKRVVTEAIAVYLYSTFLALLGVIPMPAWWPHRTRLTIGAACIPMDYDTASTIFFYCVFFPLLFGIPLFYVSWAAYQIVKQKMLPPSGRRRILAIYFFRLAFVFVVMWLPGLLFLFVTSAWLDPWVQWGGGAWSHLQGLASALLSLMKPDIWNTVKCFWTCGKAGMEITDDSDPRERRRTSNFLTMPLSSDSNHLHPMRRMSSFMNSFKIRRKSSFMGEENLSKDALDIASTSNASGSNKWNDQPLSRGGGIYTSGDCGTATDPPTSEKQQEEQDSVV